MLSKNCLRILKTLFYEIFFWLLTAWLVHSAKHILIMVKATGLIFSPRGAFWHTTARAMHSSGTYQYPPLCFIYSCWHSGCTHAQSYMIQTLLSSMALLSSQSEQDEVGIVSGALCAKLQAKNLSSSSSRCISFGGQIFTPCEFECHAGKSSSRNWKMPIRCGGNLYWILLNRTRPQMVRNAAVLSPWDAILFHPLLQLPCKVSRMILFLELVMFRYNSIQSRLYLITNLWVTMITHVLADLIIFQILCLPCLLWGSVDSDAFCHSLGVAYCKVVHWRGNSFKIPSGNLGKKFVLELAWLFRSALAIVWSQLLWRQLLNCVS